MFFSEIIKNNRSINFGYLYSIKDKNGLQNYFKFKHKHGYSLDINGYNKIIHDVKNNFKFYDVVLYPETSGIYLNEICNIISPSSICIHKNTKKYIVDALLQQNMMKSEKISLFKSIDEMPDNVFQINKIKANQRKRFRHILYKTIDTKDIKNKKVLLLDDSVFSGETLFSLYGMLDIDCDVRTIYSKV